MDINNYSSLSDYNIYVLAGDPSWRVNDKQKVVDEDERKRTDGIIFDIEGSYETPASGLSLLDSSLPI